MFLIRLLYLKGSKNGFEKKKTFFETKDNEKKSLINKENEVSENNTINQIKNLTQEKKNNLKVEEQIIKKIQIKSLDDLITVCEKNKEIKLKYELETNFNLVSFEDKRIEISFNENLDKNFIKILSRKLFEWTNERWIISLSKEIGQLSKKDFQNEIQKKKLNKVKNKSIYKKIIGTFPDAELISIEDEN